MKEFKFHEAADIFPMMEGEEWDKFKENIRVNGVLHPIILQNGKILDGRNRYRAWIELGKDPRMIPSRTWEQIHFEGSKITLAEFVISTNLHRRHLTSEQKREVIAAILKESPRKSNRQVAEQVKADDKTVGKVRRELEATAEIPQLDRTEGKDGKSRPSVKEKANGQPSSAPIDDSKAAKRSVAIFRAEEAKDILMRIPKNDLRRREAIQIVIDWCEEHIDD